MLSLMFFFFAMLERVVQIISLGNNVKNWYYCHSSKANDYPIVTLNDNEKWELAIPHHHVYVQKSFQLSNGKNVATSHFDHWLEKLEPPLPFLQFAMIVLFLCNHFHHSTSLSKFLFTRFFFEVIKGQGFRFMCGLATHQISKFFCKIEKGS